MSGPVINLDQLEFEQHEHGDRFEARYASVGRQIGARKLGYRVVEVPAGKRAWPFHAHYVNEEMFFILEGQGLLRLADQEIPLRQGDFIACPPSPDQPHQIVNCSEHTLRYLAVSTMEEPDVFVYPDSGKYGVYAGSAPGGPQENRTFAVIGQLGAQVDYWDGEQ